MTSCHFTPYHFTPGDGPLLVSMPHVGTRLDPGIAGNLTEAGRAIMDTDWDVDRLYNFLEDIGASILIANYSRYVIDLNRPGDGESLYPGQSETGLCPTTSFAGEPIYRTGYSPDATEISRRKEIYWQPYHDKIRAELHRIRDKFGYAMLWDAHSIKARVPRFFDGRLPDLNLGTGGGISCDRALAERLYAIAGKSGFSAVLDGRFTGGYITRHYGNPAQNIHAAQLELSQSTYMAGSHFSRDRANRLRPVLRDMLDCLAGYIEKSVEKDEQNPHRHQKTDQQEPDSE